MKMVATETERYINKLIDVETKEYALVSVRPHSDCAIELVVGAKWEDSHRSLFGKEGLRELIENLQEVLEVLEDE